MGATAILAATFVVYYAVQLSKRLRDNLGLGFKLIGIVGVCCMHPFKRETPNGDLYGLLMMLLYYTIFQAQGCIDKFYSQSISDQLKSIEDSSAAPFAPIVLVFVNALVSPMSDDTGFVFYYPLYTPKLAMCVYTVGTWFWINIVYLVAIKWSNEKRSQLVWNVVIEPGLWAYVSHYTFVMIWVTKVVMPIEMPVFWAILTTFVFSELVIILTYYLLTGI